MIKNISPSGGRPTGDIARFARELQADRKGFLGYVYRFGYDEATVVTNDYYVMRSGGVSKSAFLLIRPGSPAELLRPEDKDMVSTGEDRPFYLVFAQVLEPTLTPLSGEPLEPFLQMDKDREGDIPARPELQWGTMTTAVVGTFFDDPDGRRIAFGGDVEMFLSPRLYTVHVPTAEMLERLVNAFVSREKGREIGELRFTESQHLRPGSRVPVRVEPDDFVGARTAIFGRRGSGKSNLIKVIADMVLASGRSVGQVIFDLDGKYAYRAPGEQAALHELHPHKCIRYTLRPEPHEAVRVLKANFYSDLALGHRIMRELYSQQVGTPAQYEQPFLSWEVLSDTDLGHLERLNAAAATRYRRQVSIYQCILHAAGFEHPPELAVDLHLNKQVREALAALLPECGSTDTDQVVRVPRVVPLEMAAAVFARAWEIYGQGSPVFLTPSGRAYFDEPAESMLTILTQHTATGSAVSGYRKFLPMRRYHSQRSGLLLRDLLDALDDKRTVIIDLSNAARELVSFFGGLVARTIFSRQMSRFTDNQLGDHYVQFYFDEAENQFPRANVGPRSFYSRLAQEGAKLHIGLVYSTSRVDAVSPDLLANTENTLVGHLNDQRAIRALTRFHEFRDVGPDVRRTTAPGFMRMVSRSHRFVVPLQVRRFGQVAPEPAPAPGQADRGDRP